MPNPFEDQVFEYIKARRPLNLSLLAATFVGVISSAIGVFRPVGEALYVPALKALGVGPPLLVKQRYACIASLYATSQGIRQELQKFGKDDSDSAKSFLTSVVGTQDFCLLLLKVPASLLPQLPDLAGLELDAVVAQAGRLLDRQDALLSSTLANGDPLEFHLLELLRRLDGAIHASTLFRDSAPNAPGRAIAEQWLKQNVSGATLTYSEFTQLSRYAAPRIDFPAEMGADTTHQALISAKQSLLEHVGQPGSKSPR